MAHTIHTLTLMLAPTVLSQIAAAGFLVCLYDCYGHGASAPFQEHLRALIEDPQVCDGRI